MSVAPNKIGDVYGIFKAYCTRVGSGPFPTELFDETGDIICKKGNEFGSVTGRKRRCGWIDLVALKYAIMLNGVTKLIMMKGDVLDMFETIKACVAYKIDGEELYAAEEDYMRRHRGQFDEDDFAQIRKDRQEDVRKAQEGYYDPDDFHIFADRQVDTTPTWNRLAEMEDEPSNRDRKRSHKDYDPHHGKGGRTRVVTHSKDFEASGEAKLRNTDPNTAKTLRNKQTRRMTLQEQLDELYATWKKKYNCDVPKFRIPKVIKGKAKKQMEEIRMIKAEMGKRDSAKDKPVMYAKLPQESTSVVMKGVNDTKEKKSEAKIQTVRFQDAKLAEKKQKEEKENPPIVAAKTEADIGGKAAVDLYNATMNVPYIVYGPDTEYSGTVLKGVFKVGNYLYTCHHPHNEKVGEFVSVVLYQNDKLISREQVQILEVFPDLDIQRLSLPKSFALRSLNVSIPITGREIRVSWKPQGSLEDGKWFTVATGKVLNIKDGKMAYDAVTKAVS